MLRRKLNAENRRKYKKKIASHVTESIISTLNNGEIACEKSYPQTENVQSLMQASPSYHKITNICRIRWFAKP